MMKIFPEEIIPQLIDGLIEAENEDLQETTIKLDEFLHRRYTDCIFDHQPLKYEKEINRVVKNKWICTSKERGSSITFKRFVPVKEDLPVGKTITLSEMYKILQEEINYKEIPKINTVWIDESNRYVKILGYEIKKELNRSLTYSSPKYNPDEVKIYNDVVKIIVETEDGRYPFNFSNPNYTAKKELSIDEFNKLSALPIKEIDLNNYALRLKKLELTGGLEGANELMQLSEGYESMRATSEASKAIISVNNVDSYKDAKIAVQDGRNDSIVYSRSLKRLIEDKRNAALREVEKMSL